MYLTTRLVNMDGKRERKKKEENPSFGAARLADGATRCFVRSLTMVCGSVRKKKKRKGGVIWCYGSGRLVYLAAQYRTA